MDKKSIVRGIILETEHNELLWQDFAQRELLTEHQLMQFKLYYQRLVSWNNEVNLTRITHLEDAIAYHFQDSLSIGHFLPFDTITSIADVGSGAGFPSIPLKIKYPHLQVTIIEVSGKRINFLESLSKELALTNVTLCQQDWRTFLRQHVAPIEYFFARASLQVIQLLHLFKPSCRYQASTLVYWASDQWEPSDIEQTHIQKAYTYRVGEKQRKLVFFAKN